ncbi:coiled-coil domain-containing protein 86 [Tribolium madens]|uniref:coiled-coil domain-containing protein 86 n=1 Tax=Tribolium madens TaxID=41895 RepID=UPI001CF738AD|nr:coiled-coil domain-containing protein 86 [Tribolium madens]
MTKINTKTSSVEKTSECLKKKLQPANTAQTGVIRGKPKSGRFWKNEKKKFSSIIKTKGIRNSFEKKQALRQELKRIKEASRAIIAAKDEEKEQKKQRRRENLKRQEENRKKSEIVQVITNTSKIKKMKKKQLRYIEKRDTV